MDPVSAVGIAAASFQFLEFTTKVLLNTVHLWDSTSTVTARHQALQAAAERLGLLTEELQNQCSAAETEVIVIGYEETEPLPVENQLRQICQYCRSEAENLQRAITSITRRDKEKPPGLWTSFRVALRSELDDSKIRQLASDMETKRRELDSVLLGCMWAESKRTRQAETDLAEQLQRWNEIIVSSAGTRRQFIPSPDSNQVASMQSVPQKHDIFFSSESALVAQNDLVNIIWSKKWKPPPDIKDTWKPLESSHWCHQAAEQITQSLEYEAMNRRHESILSAYQSTFEWIWGPPPKKLDNWSSFPAWLEEDTDNFYWISGKPGSGKSTLMKYLESHAALRSHLEKWRPNMAHAPLRVFSFFAWNTGSDIQKSSEGLMRTLLRQALEDVPELLPVVAPRHWAFWKILKRPPAISWDYENLEESLELLLSHARSRMRMFVFIDGLDEFDVPPKKLIQVIDGISRQGGLKICVASRPWYQFNDFFCRCPGLEIHKLTLNDMETLVSRSLATCMAFSERSSDEDLHNLVTEIPQKAQGVFLWVTVVLKSVVLGLERGNSIASLVEAVRRLPSELSKLFDDIWSRIPSDLKKESAQLFLLRLSCFSDRLHYVLLWAVEEWDSATNVAHIIQEEKSTFSSRKTIARRVSSRTHGLLEVKHDLIDYLHRTVEEWARMQNFQEANPDFNPNYAFLKTLCFWGPQMTKYGAVFNDDPSSDWFLLTVSVLHFAGRISHEPERSPCNGTDFVAWLIHFEEFASGLIRRSNIYIDVFLSSQFTWNGGQLLVNEFLELAVAFLIAPYVTRVLPKRRELVAHLNIPLPTVIPGAVLQLVYEPPANVGSTISFSVHPHAPSSSNNLELRKSILITCLYNDISLWGSLDMPEAVEYITKQLRARLSTAESTVHDLPLAKFLEEYSLQVQSTKPFRRRIKRIFRLDRE